MEHQSIREFVELSNEWVEQIRNCIADIAETVAEFTEYMQRLFELTTEPKNGKVKTKQSKTTYCSIKGSILQGMYIFGYPTGFL